MSARALRFHCAAALALGLAAAPAALAQTTAPRTSTQATAPDSARAAPLPASVVMAARRPAPGPPVRSADRRTARVDPWFGYDKAQHFLASGLVTVSAQYTYEVKFGGSRRGVLPASALTSLSVGLAKEVYDVYRPGGSGFSRRDLVWDALGTAVGALFIAL